MLEWGNGNLLAEATVLLENGTRRSELSSYQPRMDQPSLFDSWHLKAFRDSCLGACLNLDFFCENFVIFAESGS